MQKPLGSNLRLSRLDLSQVLHGAHLLGIGRTPLLVAGAAVGGGELATAQRELLSSNQANDGATNARCCKWLRDTY